jgi:hypothetical protein
VVRWDIVPGFWADGIIRSGEVHDLVQDGKLWRWSFAGYSLAMPVATVQEAELLTAPAIVATLAAGYRPRIHASARDG